MCVCECMCACVWAYMCVCVCVHVCSCRCTHLCVHEVCEGDNGRTPKKKCFQLTHAGVHIHSPTKLDHNGEQVDMFIPPTKPDHNDEQVNMFIPPTKAEYSGEQTHLDTPTGSKHFLT